LQKKLKEMSRDLLFAVLLSLVMIAGTLTAIFSVNGIMTDYAFHQMQKMTRHAASDVKIMFSSEEQKVRLIADMLAGHGILQEADFQRYIHTLSSDDDLFDYCVLRPDNSMVDGGGETGLLAEPLDFAQEAARAPYFADGITGRDGEKYLLYAYPVRAGDEVRAVAYGYAPLRKLPELFHRYGFGGQEQIYLVNGDTGNFLIDTWHGELGNIFDDDLQYRETKQGRSFAELRQDVAEGQAGSLVFTSQTAGEDFYSSYEPVGLHNLTFQISVPEHVLFADVFHIRSIVSVLGLLQFLGFICYLAYLMYKYHLEKQTYQRRIQMSRDIYRIQQMLFDSYDNNFMVDEALKLAANSAEAELMFFVLTSSKAFRRVYCWPDVGKDVVNLELVKVRGKLTDAEMALRRGETVKLSPKQVAQYRREGRLDKLAGKTIKNLILVPALNSEGRISGVMVAVNVQRLREAAKGMEMIVNTFLMTDRNLSIYQLVRQMGMEDSLTGLKNRNAFSQAMSRYEDLDSGNLSCIYMDANGLHALNNTLGHAAGDDMLISIANLLKESFGSDNSFRIGGDEFVVFNRDLDQEEIGARLAKIDSLLEKQGYHVSAGVAFRRDKKLVQQMIEAAEHEMYQAKRQYYSQNKEAGRVRQMNHKLENILAEKRDRDSFLSIILADFIGVYIVNLATDDVRDICKSPYFADILMDYGYRFRPAILKYGERFVVPEEQECFKKIFDYRAIRGMLQRQEPIEFHYDKTDGQAVRIKVFPTQEYTEEKPNTLWVFEAYKG